MLKRMLFGSVLIFGTVAALAPDAMAQEFCADRDVIVAKLTGELGEVRVDGAAAGPSAFYELYASQSTRTWTILLSGVNGLSCVVAVGEDWRRPVGPIARMHGGWPRPDALLVR